MGHLTQTVKRACSLGHEPDEPLRPALIAVGNTMTRDEEIRQDLERQWRDADLEKTGSDLGKVVQNFREFTAMINGVVKRNAQDRQHSSDSDDGHLYIRPEAVDLRIQPPNQRSRHRDA